jgi:Protein of unknown function (DUF2442)
VRTSKVLWVDDARALANYRLWLKFSNGQEGEIDLSNFIKTDTRPIVRALLDPDTFAALRVALDTVVWDNGFDLAPEFLQDHLMVKSGVDQQNPQ